MSEKQKKISKLGFYMLALSSGGAQSLNSVMSLYIEKFSQYPSTTVYQIITLPALLTMFMNLFAGFVIGRKLSWKKSFIIGSVLYAVGALPLFNTDHLYFMIACNVIARLGMGMMMYRAAAAIDLFGGAEGGKVIAWMATIASVGLVFISQAVGILGTINDRLPYIPYLLSFVSLFAAAFLIRGEKYDAVHVSVKNDSSQQKEKQTEPSKKKMLFPPYVIIVVVLYSIYVIATQYPLMLGASQYVAATGMGSTQVAGTIIAASTVATMLTGPFYGKLEKIFKRYLWAFSCALTAVGIFIFAFTPSLLTCCIGNGLRNFGWSLISTSMVPYLTSADPENKALMSSTYMVANNLMNYCSAYYLALVGNLFYGGDTIVGPIQVGVYVAIAAMILTIIVDPRPKAYIEQAKETAK